MAQSKGPLLAQGRTAEIFAWGEHHVLKLLHSGAPSAAQAEAHNARAAHAGGVPTPKVIAVLEYAGRAGIIFERVKSVSMLHVLVAQPWRLWPLARAFAALHAAIHRVQAWPTLPTAHARLRQSISAAALPEPLQQRTLMVLEKLAHGQQLCHGDFHPDNVVFDQAKTLVLDWPNAVAGHPLADVMRTSIVLRVGALPPGLPAWLRVLLTLLRTQFHTAYLRRYMQLTGHSPNELLRWQAPLAAARICENIPTEGAPLRALIAQALEHE